MMTGRGSTDEFRSQVREWTGEDVTTILPLTSREGTYVFHVTTAGHDYVLKTAPSPSVRGDEVRNEHNILCELRGHDRDQRPTGFSDDGNRVTVLLPWQSGEAIPAFLASIAVKQDLRIRQWLQSAFHAMRSMHSRGLAHGDVQPGHLLFNSSAGEVSLIDFGVAGPIGSEFDGGLLEFFSPDAARRQLAGAPIYRSVEDDMYAVAVSLLFAARGGTIYHYESAQHRLAAREARLRAIAGGHIRRPARLEDTSDVLRSVRSSVQLWRHDARAGQVELSRAVRQR